MFPSGYFTLILFGLAVTFSNGRVTWTMPVSIKVLCLVYACVVAPVSIVSLYLELVWWYSRQRLTVESICSVFLVVWGSTGGVSEGVFLLEHDGDWVIEQFALLRKWLYLSLPTCHLLGLGLLVTALPPIWLKRVAYFLCVLLSNLHFMLTRVRLRLMPWVLQYIMGYPYLSYPSEQLYFLVVPLGLDSVVFPLSSWCWTFLLLFFSSVGLLWLWGICILRSCSPSVILQRACSWFLAVLLWMLSSVVG